LADPAPILNTLIVHPYLSRRFLIDSVVTVVDAVNGESTLEAHQEARRQVAVADRLVLTKADLADEKTVSSLAARLHRLNPTAPLLDPASGQAGFASLFDAGLYAPHLKIPDVARWLSDEAHGHHDGDEAHSHGHRHGEEGHSHSHDVNRHDERI